MNRHRKLIAAAAAIAVAGIVPAPSGVDAATYHFEGVVIDYRGDPAPDVEVIATEPGISTPGWTTTTAADGTWSFDAAADEYQLYFDGGSDYLSGYRGCSGYLFPDMGSACTNGPGFWTTYVVASFSSGRILDAATFDPVAGAVVTVYREDGTTLIDSATTATDGTYRVDGIDHEEIGVFVDGSPVGYSSGWFACAEGAVAPTFGEACTHAPGDDGDRFLVGAVPPRFFALSIFRGSITLIVTDAGVDGEILGYELSCRSRRTGEVTTAVYERRFQTMSGFDRGSNRCRLQVLTPTVEGPASRAHWVWVR